MEFCKCMKVMQFREAWAAIWDELIEWVEEPSKDEFSDIMWGVGRLIAGVFGKVYVSMPFDGLHREKVEARIKKFGCVRSERHLINGKCPEEGGSGN